ncbi:hypothetical protein COPG_00131 [Colwellia phage 9A]|uniref:Uncharacterized protein n=1 Tax=Colwellia phage 9A TaxID=765765 RepID=I3UML2_9CAUD|nr:hypothetical protein COPG_00131 [Colwellia phage 9A]AFK66727.1 hypothetical protein COPG_00131 [Colwellia phage 9A]
MNRQILSVLLRANNKNLLTAEMSAQILFDMAKDFTDSGITSALGEAVQFCKQYSTDDHYAYVKAVAAIYFTL